jgi:hypothetical protein
MKTQSLFIAICMMLLGQWALPQQAARHIDRPAEPNLAFDDDGGKVQFVPADLAAAAEKQFHGGKVMTQVQQVSIFLGGGWAEAQARSRQPALADVAVNDGSVHTAELRKHSVKVLRAAPDVQEFSDLSKAPLNDLDIQRKLSTMLENKAIPAPSASTVYVVFLGPEASSTLGGLKAGEDYAAYHNVVNLEAGEVRYAVVPFHRDSANHRTAAMRALSETALNPTGQGWF